MSFVERFLLKSFIKVLGIKIKHYQNPLHVGGWKSWIETRFGTCIGFLHQDGRLRLL